MLEKLLDLLQPGSPKEIEDARKNSLVMLTTAREMFHMAINAIDAESPYSVRAQLARMDKQINREQLELRQRVTRHLKQAKRRQLLEGLQLVSISLDLERMGDYIKGIGELVDMLPGKLTFGKYEREWATLKSIVIELFDLTKAALLESDERKGSLAIRQYHTVSKTSEEILRRIFEEYGGQESIPRWCLGVSLILLYIHRVAAHLKNVCSAVVNPFHRIGFSA
ncbi:MAG: hypothetical protein JW797_16160 [Bradymonadales bacterium]|nr:hypothetical protein [Bradymonadales bacterium]